MLVGHPSPGARVGPRAAPPLPRQAPLRVLRPAPRVNAINAMAEQAQCNEIVSRLFPRLTKNKLNLDNSHRRAMIQAIHWRWHVGMRAQVSGDIRNEQAAIHYRGRRY